MERRWKLQEIRGEEKLGNKKMSETRGITSF